MTNPTLVKEAVERIAEMSPPDDPHTDAWTLGFCRARKMAADIARRYGWTDEENAAIRQLGVDLDLSDMAVLRQALRSYQSDHMRRKSGETCVWSGDAQRVADFVGPLAALPTDDDDTVERMRGEIGEAIRKHMQSVDPKENWDWEEIGRIGTDAAIHTLIGRG